MNRSFNHKVQSEQHSELEPVEVKSKYGAEFRRFSVNRIKPGKFEEFFKLILNLHNIASIEVMIGYADVHGDLLPINNDDNFCKAVSTAHPLLRIFIQKQEEVDYSNFGTNTLTRKKKPGVPLRNDMTRKRPHIRIGLPQDFRPVSSIIDVDILPESHRRVRLYRHGSHKPLGFYIRDGTSVRVTAHGLEKVPGIFISRLVPGGLAEGTGLLAVNDEVLEVNGIEVTGKTLDQVTDMMIANSHNLIVTVKPANQRNNVVRASRTSGSSGQSSDSSSSSVPLSMPPVASSYPHDDLDSDEESDIIIESSIHRPSRHSHASLASVASRSTQASPPKPQSRPVSVVSTASFHSQASLNGHNGLTYRLHRDLNVQQGAYDGVRHSNGSLHKILSSLRTDPRHSLVMPSGGVEEDGMVITL